MGYLLRDEMVRMLKGIPGLSTVVLNINRDNTNVILGNRNEVLYGPGYIEDRLGDLRFRISPMAFYQVNPVQALKVYETALDYASLIGNEEVWDICCGIGTITLFLARRAGKVHGLEIVPEAIEDAKVNAELNGIKNVDFTAAAAEKYLPSLASMKADVVVMDPPRSGLERPALDAVVKALPSRIVYVSCNPGTMARDIKVFLAAGYRLVKFRAVDQFCHTSSVEMVVRMDRCK